MSVKIRNRKSFKKKYIIYILLLIILGCSAFFLNLNFFSRRPLFVSPLGKADISQTLIEKKLKDNNILFSDIKFLPDSSYVINVSDSGQIRFSQTKDVEKQISSLQRILKSLTIEGKPFKSIDFRFSEPIISF